jgi:glycosyltransferase involved in cell wall biosynthesis
MRIGLIIYGDLETMTGGFLYDRMMVDTLREKGDTVEVISLPWLPYGPALFLNASLSLIKRLKNGSFDLVLEDELVHPSFFILNTGLRSLIKCPIIAVVHHLRSQEERPDWQNRFYGIVEKRFLRTVDGFIFNSRATLNTVIPWAKKNRPSVVAYPGRDRFGLTITEEELTARVRRSGPIELLFVGALIPRKGLHTLISALATLDPGIWHLTVAGDQNRDYRYKKVIRRQIVEAGIVNRVSFLGEVSDPHLAALYERSQVLIVPSSLEGFGISYLEGMGFGLPAVASKVGGAMEIVSHGENGFLLSSGDVRTLATYVLELAQDRDRLLKMSLAARQTFLAHPTWTDSGRVSHDFLHQLGGLIK